VEGSQGKRRDGKRSVVDEACDLSLCFGVGPRLQMKENKTKPTDLKKIKERQ